MKMFNMGFAITEKGQAIKVAQNLITNSDFIKLAKGDKIITSFLYNDQKIESVLCVTKNGFGVRINLSDIRSMGPGGGGVKFVKLTPRTGTVVIAIGLNKKDKNLEIVTLEGKNIKLNIDEIPLLNRGSQGVKIVKLEGKDTVKNVS